MGNRCGRRPGTYTYPTAIFLFGTEQKRKNVARCAANLANTYDFNSKWRIVRAVVEDRVKWIKRHPQVTVRRRLKTTPHEHNDCHTFDELASFSLTHVIVEITLSSINSKSKVILRLTVPSPLLASQANGPLIGTLAIRQSQRRKSERGTCTKRQGWFRSMSATRMSELCEHRIENATNR